MKYETESSKTIDRRPIMLLCVLLSLVVASKTVAAQPNRPFSPGQLIFDAEVGGPTQNQVAILNNYTSFDNATATSGGCPWATIPGGISSGKYLVVEVNPLGGT